MSFIYLFASAADFIFYTKRKEKEKEKKKQERKKKSSRVLTGLRRHEKELVGSKCTPLQKGSLIWAYQQESDFATNVSGTFPYGLYNPPPPTSMFNMFRPMELIISRLDPYYKQDIITQISYALIVCALYIQRPHLITCIINDTL